jgi:hypothetical protein
LIVFFGMIIVSLTAISPFLSCLLCVCTDMKVAAVAVLVTVACFFSCMPRVRGRSNIATLPITNQVHTDTDTHGVDGAQEWVTRRVWGLSCPEVVIAMRFGPFQCDACERALGVRDLPPGRFEWSLSCDGRFREMTLTHTFYTDANVEIVRVYHTEMLLSDKSRGNYRPFAMHWSSFTDPKVDPEARAVWSDDWTIGFLERGKYTFGCRRLGPSERLVNGRTIGINCHQTEKLHVTATDGVIPTGGWLRATPSANKKEVFYKERLPQSHWVKEQSPASRAFDWKRKWIDTPKRHAFQISFDRSLEATKESSDKFYASVRQLNEYLEEEEAKQQKCLEEYAQRRAIAQSESNRFAVFVTVFAGFCFAAWLLGSVLWRKF